MIKLVGLDIDGTLVNRRFVIPRINALAIRRAAYERDVKIAIISGRISQSAKAFADYLKVEGPISSFGGCLLEAPDYSILEEFNIDAETSAVIIERARKYNVTLLLYHRHDWYTETTADPKWRASEFGTTHIPDTVLEDLSSVLGDFTPNKFLAVQEDGEKLMGFRDEINLLCPGKVNMFKSAPAFLEVVPPAANKGQAVKGLCKYYGFSKDEVMTIGDYYNDIFMFNESGVAVAVANAPDDVKKHATYVTVDDYSNGAVAEAIYKFVF